VVTQQLPKQTIDWALALSPQQDLSHLLCHFSMVTPSKKSGLKRVSWSLRPYQRSRHRRRSAAVACFSLQQNINSTVLVSELVKPVKTARSTTVRHYTRVYPQPSATGIYVTTGQKGNIPHCFDCCGFSHCRHLPVTTTTPY
jgi:hypothetical protein